MAKSLTQIVDLLDTKSAQSTEIYPCVSASGSLACIQTLFNFSFRSFQKHRRARERSERATTPVHWRSINPPKFIFYYARSTDFEEQIEGL